MKNRLKKITFLLAIITSGIASAQVQMNFEFDEPYGNNKEVGKYATINGAKIYFEEYGVGEPLFLIHGNGASINSMGNQIEYFKANYRVIIADNRGHGKSELKTDSLTYVQIADDWNGLAAHLKLDSVNIIGWSDGGIIGLLMGISKQVKMKKLIAMGANLRPDSSAVYSWAVNDVERQRQIVALKIKENDISENWILQKQIIGLLGDQPSILVSDLSKIKVPVLIISGDKDIIREEHSIEMYQNIPNAQLCIMPGETHYSPASNPELFNTIANRFLSEPFKRPDSDWTKW